MEVPYVDLPAGYQSLKSDIDAAVSRVLAGGAYVLGSNVAAFESEFGAWLGGGEAAGGGAAVEVAGEARGVEAGGVEVAGVGSGTDAIYLVLKALGIGPGDEVITISHTAINTALAVSKTGAVPVLVDIDAETFCMDPAALEGALTPRTRAVLPVHLYGHPVDMDPVMEFASRHGLAVVEDCAQAHGARYRGRLVGTIGAAGCFSFYPTKNLGACGDGGAVASRDPQLIAKIRSLANCGQGDERYVNLYKGEVSRLDELQAAILRVKLRALDGWTEQRRSVADFYRRELAGVPGIILPVEREWARHVYHLYVIRSGRRDELQKQLTARGVRSLVHYPVPVHRQPAYAEEMAGFKLPVSEEAVAEILSLPCFPEITNAQLEHVAQAVTEFW